MNSDCAYRMGKTHAVCQDYALARGGERPYVLLADGCSSSPDTDVGARLLVRSAAKILPEVPVWGRPEEIEAFLQDYHLRTIRAARTCVRPLGLNSTALDATLLTAFVCGPAWGVAVYGDGVIARQDSAGRIHIHAITYTGGFPYYLNYALDEGRRAGFLAQRENCRKHETWILLPEGGVEERGCRIEAADAPFYWDTGESGPEAPEWLALMSDGVHSFTQMVEGETSRTTIDVPLPQVLRELLCLRNTNGVFVQRRLQRFEQTCMARRWQHRDDLALGVIALGAG